MCKVVLDEVVLDEDDLPGRDGAAGPAPAEQRTPARRSRARWIVAAAIVATLVAGAAVEGHRAREREARLAAVPGLLAPLTPSVQELWRRSAGWAGWATADGDLVVATSVYRGGTVLAGVDGVTGAEQWTAPLPELTGTGDLQCEPLEDALLGQTTHLACRVLTAMVPLHYGRRALAPGAASLLVVLDAGTGERVLERSLDSRHSSVGAFGRDLLLVEVLSDGHGQVTRQDPVTGRVRWTLRSPRPLPVTGSGAAPSAPVADVRHGLIEVDGTAAWAIGPDGTLLGEWHPVPEPPTGDLEPRVALTVLPDGRFAVAQPGPAGRDPHATVSVSDARDGFSLPGAVLVPAVDDGSAPDVLLTEPPGRTQIVAMDSRSGERLWRMDSNWRREVLVLDRRLIVAAGGLLTARDLRSGDAVWTYPISGGRSTRQLLTDGHVVLLVTSGLERRARLTAVGLDDGLERWTAAAPRDVTQILASGGRLIAVAGDEIIGLG